MKQQKRKKSERFGYGSEELFHRLLLLRLSDILRLEHVKNLISGTAEHLSRLEGTVQHRKFKQSVFKASMNHMSNVEKFRK